MTFTGQSTVGDTLKLFFVVPLSFLAAMICYAVALQGTWELLCGGTGPGIGRVLRAFFSIPT